MADFNHFEGMNPEEPVNCSVCEALVPDAVDGLLTEAQQRAFDRHVAGCVACARELEEAQRGAAWLSMLKSKAPEPPADLLAKILAGTTGAAATPTVFAAPVAEAEPAFIPAILPAKPEAPAWALSSLWRRSMSVFRLDASKVTFQPRLAMTAAMAFFSVALTLNLMGVRLKDINAADFTPNGLRHAASDMSASATQKFQNLKVVYQLESRVSELREDESPLNSRGQGPTEPRTGDSTEHGGDATQPAPQQSPDPSNGQNGAPGHTQLIQPVMPRRDGQAGSQSNSLRKDL